MIATAEAPAAIAWSVLRAKVQPPRWISAMFPSGKPAKSSGSQPLPTPSDSVSTGVAAAVTSPAPEYCIVAKSSPGVKARCSGAVCPKTGSDSSCQKSNVKSWIFGLYPALRS